MLILDVITTDPGSGWKRTPWIGCCRAWPGRSGRLGRAVWPCPDGSLCIGAFLFEKPDGG